VCVRVLGVFCLPSFVLACRALQRATAKTENETQREFLCSVYLNIDTIRQLVEVGGSTYVSFVCVVLSECVRVCVCE